MKNRVELCIDLARIAANYRKIAAAAMPCLPLPVIKADAYNMGAVRVGKTLREAGASRLLVATLNEAMEIKECGLPIQIVGSILPHEIPTAVAEGITCPANDLSYARMLSAEAVRQNKTVTCHIQIDTGMGRDGIPVAGAAVVIAEILNLPGVEVAGIYSHFPGAVPGYDEFTNRQIKAFKELLSSLNYKFSYIHFGGGDGANFPETFHAPFTHCRAGLAMYGLGSTAASLNLEPVFTLKSVIAQVRQLPGGTSIGYSFTHHLKNDTRVGTVAIGYADGMPLALSNRGRVIVHGKPCPILGRVSMDYVNIDLSAVPETQPGDEVICLGNGITVDEWAEFKQTHPHEILCALGRRAVKTYR